MLVCRIVRAFLISEVQQMKILMQASKAGKKSKKGGKGKGKGKK